MLSPEIDKKVREEITKYLSVNGNDIITVIDAVEFALKKHCAIRYCGDLIFPLIRDFSSISLIFV